MAYHFSAHQYNDAFSPKRLGNWEVSPPRVSHQTPRGEFSNSRPSARSEELERRILNETLSLPLINRFKNRVGQINQKQIKSEPNINRRMNPQPRVRGKLGVPNVIQNGIEKYPQYEKYKQAKRLRQKEIESLRKDSITNPNSPPLLSPFESEFADWLQQKRPIIWVFGRPPEQICNIRKKFCLQLAKTFDFAFLDLEDHLRRWDRKRQELEHWGINYPYNAPPPGREFPKEIDPVAEGHQRVIRMAQRIMNHPHEQFSLDGIMELLKLAMLETPAKGFIIDSFPTSRIEAARFEKTFYRPILGIYFLSYEWTTNKSKTPVSLEPIFLRRDAPYCEREVELTADEFGYKTLKIINSEDIGKNETSYLNSLVTVFLTSDPPLFPEHFPIQQRQVKSLHRLPTKESQKQEETGQTEQIGQFEQMEQFREIRHFGQIEEILAPLPNQEIHPNYVNEVNHCEKRIEMKKTKIPGPVLPKDISPKCLLPIPIHLIPTPEEFTCPPFPPVYEFEPLIPIPIQLQAQTQLISHLDQVRHLRNEVRRAEQETLNYNAPVDRYNEYDERPIKGKESYDLENLDCSRPSSPKAFEITNANSKEIVKGAKKAKSKKGKKFGNDKNFPQAHPIKFDEIELGTGDTIGQIFDFQFQIGGRKSSKKWNSEPKLSQSQNIQLDQAEIQLEQHIKSLESLEAPPPTREDESHLSFQIQRSLQQNVSPRPRDQDVNEDAKSSLELISIFKKGQKPSIDKIQIPEFDIKEIRSKSKNDVKEAHLRERESCSHLGKVSRERAILAKALQDHTQVEEDLDEDSPQRTFSWCCKKPAKKGSMAQPYEPSISSQDDEDEKEMGKKTRKSFFSCLRSPLDQRPSMDSNKAREVLRKLEEGKATAKRSSVHFDLKNHVMEEIHSPNFGPSPGRSAMANRVRKQSSDGEDSTYLTPSRIFIGSSAGNSTGNSPEKSNGVQNRVGIIEVEKPKFYKSESD